MDDIQHAMSVQVVENRGVVVSLAEAFLVDPAVPEPLDLTAVHPARHGAIHDQIYLVPGERRQLLRLDLASKPFSLANQSQKGEERQNIPQLKIRKAIRWLNSLRQTKEAIFGSQIQVITICDREGDFYELFEQGHHLQASLLIRAATDRNINKTGSYCKKQYEKLWDTIQALPCSGIIDVEIPARDQKPGRIAHLETRFGSIIMNPPCQHIRHRTEKLPHIVLYAVNVIEKSPPVGEEALEWMLLTDLQVISFEEAKEKVAWYCLRWRIEVFHKTLKSGLKVEQCRLQRADRLIRYLTVMSIIAWRIYWLTLIARTDPELPCTAFFCC